MNTKKITHVNGFDPFNEDNAMQNNYAWGMVEFNGYLYVGTGRNVPLRGFQVIGITPPKSYVPEDQSQAPEIWRYPIGKTCHCDEARWKRVYRAPENFGPVLFRSMVTYTNASGKEAIYGGSYQVNGQGYLLTSEDGLEWNSIEYPVAEGYFIRPMKVFENQLYAANCQPLFTNETSYLYVSDNPELGWRRVNTDVIQGEIFSMALFNGYLYVGAMPAGGFAIWKSNDPESGNWELVVDKGAGEGLNEIPMIMEEFNGYLYIGSGINGAILSTNPDNRWVLPKGYDVIRVSRDDNWEVIIGKEPILPTDPTTGVRNNGLYHPGFGNMFNPYCWSMKEYRGRLYIGTWDSAIFYKTTLLDWIESDQLVQGLLQFAGIVLSQIDFDSLDDYDYGIWLRELKNSFRNYPQSLGFDMLVTDDGEHFEKYSIDGFRNPENYGIRNLYEASDNKLYIGTANPTQGCEVWVSDHRCC